MKPLDSFLPHARNKKLQVEAIATSNKKLPGTRASLLLVTRAFTMGALDLRPDWPATFAAAGLGVFSKYPIVRTCGVLVCHRTGGGNKLIDWFKNVQDVAQAAQFYDMVFQCVPWFY